MRTESISMGTNHVGERAAPGMNEPSTARDATSGWRHSGGTRGDGSEFTRFVADVEELLKRVTPLGDAELERVKTRVQDGLATARDTMTSGTRRAVAQSREMALAADGYVHERPWQVVGVAALVGALAGFLAARR
jgi:ElaB protein